jgi:hypothetical protein
MSFLRNLALPLGIALTLSATPAVAQTPPPAPGDAPQKQLDPAGKELGAKTDALSKQAAELVEAYKKAIEARIQKLGVENPPLGRLTKAGVFTVNAIMAGVSSDPLEALPYVRKQYEDLDETAQKYMTEFGSKAKQSAEEQAVAFMKKIVAAETSFREDDKDGNGILDYAPSFGDLIQAGLLNLPTFKKNDTSVVVGGYRFRITHADLLTWAADAAPVSAEEGNTYFYADQTNKIRAEKGKAAGPTSPEWKPAGQ